MCYVTFVLPFLPGLGLFFFFIYNKNKSSIFFFKSKKKRLKEMKNHNCTVGVAAQTFQLCCHSGSQNDARGEEGKKRNTNVIFIFFFFFFTYWYGLIGSLKVSSKDID